MPIFHRRGVGELLNFLSLLLLVHVPSLLEADESWKNGCEPGHELVRCVQLVDRYQEGDALFPKDLPRASSLRLSAITVASVGCADNDAEACRHAGGLIASDDTLDPGMRVEKLRVLVNSMVEACSEGDPYQCKEIIKVVTHRHVRAFQKKLIEASSDHTVALESAFDYARRIGLEEKRRSARSLEAYHEAACQKSDSEACIFAARVHADTRRPMTYDPAVISRLLDTCLNSAKHCDDADRYLYILGEKDAVRHQKYLDAFRLSCSGAHPVHCFIATVGGGNIDSLEDVVRQNCENGIAFRCILVGDSYLYEGTKKGSVTSNPKALQAARKWYDLGCIQGQSYACHTLEHMDRQGL